MAYVDEDFGSQPEPEDQDLATQADGNLSNSAFFTQLPQSPTLKRPFDELSQDRGLPEDSASQAEKRQRRNDAILALLPSRNQIKPIKPEPSEDVGPRAVTSGIAEDVQIAEQRQQTVPVQQARIAEEPAPSALAVAIDLGGSRQPYLSVEYDPTVAGSEAEALARALGSVVAQPAAAEVQDEEREDAPQPPDTDDEPPPPLDEQVVTAKLREFDTLCDARDFEEAANLLRGCALHEMEEVLARTQRGNADAILPFFGAARYSLDAIAESEKQGLEYLRSLKNMDLRPASGTNPRLVLEYPLYPLGAWALHADLDDSRDMVQSPASERSAEEIPWSSSPPRPAARDEHLLRPFGNELPPDSSCSAGRGGDGAATDLGIDNQTDIGTSIVSARPGWSTQHRPDLAGHLPDDGSSSDLEMVEPHAYGEAVDPMDPPSSPPRIMLQPVGSSGYRFVETPHVRAQDGLPRNSSSPIAAASQSLTSPEMLIPGTREEVQNEPDGAGAGAGAGADADADADADEQRHRPQKRQHSPSPRSSPRSSRSSQKKSLAASTSDPWRVFSQTALSQSPSQALRERRRQFFLNQAEQQANEDLSNSATLLQPPSQALRERRQQFFDDQAEHQQANKENTIPFVELHRSPKQSASTGPSSQQAPPQPPQPTPPTHETHATHTVSTDPTSPLSPLPDPDQYPIYATYKQTYPSYTGTPAHFAQLCALLHRAPDALHPSLWDDFVAAITLHRLEGIANAASDPLDYYGRAADEPAYRAHVLRPANIREAAAPAADSLPSGGEPQTQAQPGQQSLPHTQTLYQQSAQHQSAISEGDDDQHANMTGLVSAPPLQTPIRTETRVHAHIQPQTQLQTQPQSQWQTETQSQTPTSTHTQTQAHAQTQTQSQTRSHEAHPQTQPQTETNPDPIPDPQTHPRTEGQEAHAPPDPKSKANPHPNLHRQPQPQLQPKTHQNPQAKQRTKTRLTNDTTPLNSLDGTNSTTAPPASSRAGRPVGHVSGFAVRGVPADAEAAVAYAGQRGGAGGVFREWAVAFAGLRVHTGALGSACVQEGEGGFLEGGGSIQDGKGGRLEGGGTGHHEGEDGGGDGMLLSMDYGNVDIAAWDL